MLFFASTCELPNFVEVIVVVSESTEKDIELALAPFEKDLDLEFFAIPDEEDYGTADTLRLLHSKKKIMVRILQNSSAHCALFGSPLTPPGCLQTDMLIIACDLITDLCLQDVANVFRLHDASLAAVYQKLVGSDVPVPGAKSKKQHGKAYQGIVWS